LAADWSIVLQIIPFDAQPTCTRAAFSYEGSFENKKVVNIREIQPEPLNLVVNDDDDVLECGAKLAEH
jgi:hypothetical protein